VVVLNESTVDPSLDKISSIPNFGKEAALIADPLGDDDLNFR